MSRIPLSDYLGSRRARDIARFGIERVLAEGESRNFAQPFPCEDVSPTRRRKSAAMGRTCPKSACSCPKMSIYRAAILPHCTLPSPPLAAPSRNAAGPCHYDHDVVMNLRRSRMVTIKRRDCLSQETVCSGSPDIL